MKTATGLERDALFARLGVIARRVQPVDLLAEEQPGLSFGRAGLRGDMGWFLLLGNSFAWVGRA
jgi:hypothetical protein